MANTSFLTIPLPFPATGWWAAVLAADSLLLDGTAPFRKMSDRNRYRIATAAGAQLLSVPVSGGRAQRTPLGEILIAGSGWQEQHWRTVFSAYGRAAYFEHYAPELDAIYHDTYDSLAVFNIRTIRWAMKALRIPAEHLAEANADVKATIDWRNAAPEAYQQTLSAGAAYHQVFGNRHGFLANLSILDLLMNEGPSAGDWLRRARAPEWFF